MAAKLAVPNTAEGLQEALTNKTTLKTLIDEGSFPDFMSAYAKEFNKADPGVNENVQNQIDQALASFAREHLADLRTLGKKKVSAADVRDGKQVAAEWSGHAPGTPINGTYENMGQYLADVHHLADRFRPDSARAGRLDSLRNAFSSDIPSEGGFLIPEEFRTELLSIALESAVVRPRARVIPMASARVALPMLDSTSNASSVFGGVVAYWTEEAAALVESTPTFARVVLDAKKLTAYSDIPNELAMDSAISLDAFQGMAYPEALAWYEDAAFLGGTGVGEPLGVLSANNTALVTQNAKSGQGANTIVWDNVVNMYARMLPSSLNRAVWVCSPDAFPQLALMQAPGNQMPIWINNGTQGPPATLLGRPLIITEKANVLGTAGDINFVDFGYYLIGDRMAMSAMSSPHYKFGQDITSYRIIERVDGRPWIQSAITPKNGGPTLSPFVNLNASRT